jgi:hypothetical protein
VPTAPRYTEVERAIRSVPGVAEASVVQAADSGRGRLRIRLHPGEDADRVSWSVAATLRERFGIALDPEEIRPSVSAATRDNGHGTSLDESGTTAAGDDAAPPQPPAASETPAAVPTDAGTGAPDPAGRADGPAPADPSGTSGGPADPLDRAEPADPWDVPAASPAGEGIVVEELADPTPPPPAHIPASASGAEASGQDGSGENGSGRAVIRDLRSRTEADGVMVTATLDYSGRLAEGRSTGVPTTRGLLRTIAEATMMALGELTGQRLRAQIDRVSLAGCDPTTVTVVVTQLSSRGEELLLGASIVRDDVEHAVMRATLDALNRRVQPDLSA